MKAAVDVTFDFTDLGGCASHCRARVFRTGAASGAALTELADNPGTSVTNAFESVAAQVCDFYGLDGADVVWVEHYPDARTPREREWGAPDPIFEEHFSAVNFGAIEARAEGWLFESPRWSHLEQSQLENLIGAPWVPESE